MAPPLESLRQGKTLPAVLAGLIACALIVALVTTPAGHRFLNALRIARPAAVTAAAPGSASAGRESAIQRMIGGMLASNVIVLVDEPDQPVANAGAAAKFAGFAPHLPRGRKDTPTLLALGAHKVEMTVDLAQLRTIFDEAGQHAELLPESLEGTKVVLATPRGLRAQYGNCPVPPAATIQGQVQGPPPPSADNASCVVLVEVPPVVADVPPTLDVAPLMEIALELSGMSPVQARSVPKTLDWKATLAISFPRGLRSMDSVRVNGAPAMLLVTAGRRGPTWVLMWQKSALVYALSGYGNSADALAIANAIE